MICTSIFIFLFYLSIVYSKNENHTSCGCGPFKFLCISERTFIGCGDSDNDDGECPEGTRCDPLNAFHCTPKDALASPERKAFVLPPCFKRGIFLDPNDSRGYFKCNKGVAEPLEWVLCPKDTSFSCKNKASCETIDKKKNKSFLKILQNKKRNDPWDLKSYFFKHNKTKINEPQNNVSEIPEYKNKALWEAINNRKNKPFLKMLQNKKQHGPWDLKTNFFKPNKTKIPISQNITNEIEDIEMDDNSEINQLSEDNNFECSGIGNFSDGKSERNYIECVQDEHKNFISCCHTCPIDKYFSQEKRKCIRPPCLQSEPFDCHAAGKFKTPGLSPSKYYECFENKNKTFSWIIKSCDFGEKFDCLTECCVPDEFVYCNKGNRIIRSMRTNLILDDIKDYWPILNDNDNLLQKIHFIKRKKGNHRNHGQRRTMTNFDKDWSEAKEDFDLRSKYLWDTKNNFNFKDHHKKHRPLKLKFNFNSKIKQSEKNNNVKFINKAVKEIQPEDFFNSKSSNILKNKENADLDFNILDDKNLEDDEEEMAGNDDDSLEKIFGNQDLNTQDNNMLDEYNNVEEQEQMDGDNDDQFKFIYKNKDFKKHNNHVLNKDKNEDYDYDEIDNDNLVGNSNRNNHFRKIKSSNRFELDNRKHLNNNKFRNRNKENFHLNFEKFHIGKHDWKDPFMSSSKNTKEDYIDLGDKNNQNMFHLNEDELEPLFNGYKQFFALTNPLFFAKNNIEDDDSKLSNNNEFSFLKLNQETPEISDSWIASDELTNRADIFELKNDDNELSSSDYVAVVDARACRGPRCNKEAKNETVFQCNEAGNFADCSCEQAFYTCKPSQDGHSRFDAFHTYCSDDQFFCERKHKCVRPPCSINGNFKCHAVGKFKNNEDMHKYYNCFKDKDNKLVMSQSECPSGGIFDCNTRECNTNTEGKGANKAEAKGASKTEANGANKTEASGANKIEANGANKIEANGANKIEAKGPNNTETKISNSTEAKTTNDLSRKDFKNETCIEPPAKNTKLDNSSSVNIKHENATTNSTSSGNKEKINIKDKHKTNNETIQQKLDKEADKCVESEFDNYEEKTNNHTTVSSKNQTVALNNNTNICICPDDKDSKNKGNQTNHEVNKVTDKKAPTKKEKNHKSKANDSCTEDLDFDLMEDQCHNDTFTTNTSSTATLPNNITTNNFNNHTKTTAQTSSSNSTSKMSRKNNYHRKAKLKHFLKDKKMKYRDRNKRDELQTNKTINSTIQPTTKSVTNLTVTNNTNKVSSNETEETQPNECLSEDFELSELFDQMQAEPIDFKCEETGIYPDPFSHRGFIRCCPSNDEDEELVAFRFRCPHNKFFNHRIKKCAVPPCVLPQKGICLAEGNFKDCNDNSKEEDKSEYEVLEETNKPVSLNRFIKETRATNNPLNSISKEYILSKLLEKQYQDSFKKDSNKDDVNSQLTNSLLDLFVSTQPPSIAGSTMSHSDDRWQSPIGPLWDRIKRGCKEDSSGRFPDSGNCTVYYVCHGKRDVMGGQFQVQLLCPPGTQFDSIFRMCIDARVARCATVVDAFDVGEMTRDIETRLVEDAEQKENFNSDTIQSLDRRIRHLQKLISKEEKNKHKEKDLVVK